jgi:hypothetical protein
MSQLLPARRGWSPILAGILVAAVITPMLPRSHAAQKPATTPNPMSTFDARHKQFLALLDEEWGRFDPGLPLHLSTIVSSFSS